ncbi:hypothetical protein I4U23_005804 [Adineta vaga]|nr:hypothetical protein I4U23_005804 [Adineta vaga]
MASNSKTTEVHRHQRLDIQRVQNVLLIWLDSNINNGSKDCQNTITQLRHVVNDVKTYTDGKHCIQFLETIEDRKACMIISGSLGQHIVPRAHNVSQVDSIFIFCGNKHRHEEWAKEWPKIKGIFTEITPICDALKQVAQQCEQNAMSMSFMNKTREVSVEFALRATKNPDLVGILFVMKIDPGQSTTSFASIDDISAVGSENEVLFSMHSVFRVHDFKLIDKTNKLYEVSLTLTSDNDQELNALTERIREESFPDNEGWERLGLVLIQMGQNENKGGDVSEEDILTLDSKSSINYRIIRGIILDLNILVDI